MTEKEPHNSDAAKKSASPKQMGRRGFFSDAFRETLAPISSLLAKKLDPMLQALDRLPPPPPSSSTDSKTPGEHTPGTLDQPQENQEKQVPLPLYPIESFPCQRYLRPPGANNYELRITNHELDKTTENTEDTEKRRGEEGGGRGGFETVCERCGVCVEVCPAHAIQLDRRGLTADGLPYIVPSYMPCIVCDELACMKNCPTGALELVDKFEIRMGLAKVNFNTCLRNSKKEKERECRVCVEACPLGDRAILISPETGRVRVKRNGCIGCGICEHVCPTEPRSIEVFPIEPERFPIIA